MLTASHGFPEPISVRERICSTSYLHSRNGTSKVSKSTAAPRLRFETEGEYQALQMALKREAYLHGREHVAFLFASPEPNGDLRVVESTELAPEDYVDQSAEYVELRDNVFQRMILFAHQTNAALIEAHSHPFARGSHVRFSRLDHEGLAEVGPHVSWRLPGRPYVALVFGRDAFDSLYWEGGDKVPRGSVDIVASSTLIRATRDSILFWRDNYGPVRQAT